MFLLFTVKRSLPRDCNVHTAFFLMHFLIMSQTRTHTRTRTSERSMAIAISDIRRRRLATINVLDTL